MAARDGFVAIEHAMNVLIDTPRIQETARNKNLLTLIRSPLAMGLLTGKYDAKTTMPATDVRATENTIYYKDAHVNPQLLAQFEAIRELLRSGGRTQTQGALCWLWAKCETNIPIPGARTVAQIKDISQAIDFGPLPDDVMSQIEALIDRAPADAEEKEL
jgi:aryl-alcohol dehydrogenase-like predicted oxidoreductase